MPSPIHRVKSTNMTGRAAAGPFSGSDDANISDPVPHLSYPSMKFEDRYESVDGPMHDRLDGLWPDATGPALMHSRSGSHLQTTGPTDNRFSVGPSIMMSSVSSMPSLKQSQKKPVGIKATIRRMFGSKRQRVTIDEDRKDYHLSAPGNLAANKSPPSHHSPTPGSSRPRTAMQRNALGSHAVTSPDTHDLEVLRTKSRPSPPKRRNTLPSLAFSEHEAQSFSKRLGEILSDNPEQSTPDDGEISDKDKHRSKSADDLAKKFTIHGPSAISRQDRESEIAFWRNSILLNPLPKPTLPAQENIPPQESHDHIKEMPSLEHIIKPAQSFNFELDNIPNEPTDLEERVNTLEVKMFDFEYAIAKLQGVELPKPTLPTKRMKRKNIQEVFAKPSMQSLSTATTGNERRPITPRDSPVMPHSFKDGAVPDRTSNATTIRPLVRNNSPLRSSLHLTMEQFDSLVTMIQDEKDARQLMEMQIVDLQREIELLQTPVYATINYPTPSPESTQKASSQKKLHRSPPFRFNKPPVHETSRFSMAESDTESLNDSFEEKYQTPRQQQFELNNEQSSPLIDAVF